MINGIIMDMIIGVMSAVLIVVGLGIFAVVRHCATTEVGEED